MHTVATTNRLLDLAGTAAYLHDTERHVRSLWERREIAAVRIGRKVRFDRDDLDRYIDSKRVPARMNHRRSAAL
jgi:excisionase family DNA binding protein